MFREAAEPVECRNMLVDFPKSSSIVIRFKID